MINFINCRNNNKQQCQMEYSNVASCIDSVMLVVNRQYGPSLQPLHYDIKNNFENNYNNRNST